jgi:Carbohydrate family 9 binding domain-like
VKAIPTVLASVGSFAMLTVSCAAADTGLAAAVRGLVTRAAAPIKMDGNLGSWHGAFCTPVHYNHRLVADRAAQFFYVWDDDAFYVGLRALDQHRADVGDTKRGDLWNGDAVEFYFDTRQGGELRGKDWTSGAVHLFFTPFTGKELKPRWVMRGGIATSNTRLEGVEVAARNTDWGYDVAFKLPWKNFPHFQPKAGSLLGIDAELCSGDGDGRTDRTFAYGSPLSVTQPASQGLVQLVERMEDRYLPQVGPALFPLWVETPWFQGERAQVVAIVALPPDMEKRVRDVTIRIHDADGKIVKEIPATRETLPGPNFVRAQAAWSNDAYAPGTFFVTARIVGTDGQTLATVAPRLVQEAQMSGR